MRCPQHHRNDVVGYCCACGDFGCSECLTEHGGRLYCSHDFQPIAAEIERKRKQEESLARPERQRLVIHDKQGRIFCGVCFTLNTSQEGLHFDLSDNKGRPRGEARYFRFEDLKAIYYVKSFDGHYDKSQSFPAPVFSRGEEIIVVFQDGEVLQGIAAGSFREGIDRFHLIPLTEGNNVSILVEKSATTGIFTPEQYHQRREQELEEYVQQHRATSHTRAELEGDFHFQKREYNRALKHYKLALRGQPEEHRLRRKVSSAHYNLGIRCIKSKDYSHARQCMELALEADPANERAQEKADKLKLAFEKKLSEGSAQTSPLR